MFWHYCKLCRLPSAYFICNACLNELNQIPESHCKNCLKPLSTADYSCSNCNSHQIFFDQIFCQFAYAKPLNQMLNDFKYHGKTYCAWTLSYLLYLTLSAIDTPDIIIPMPLHPNRQKQRGFNQADKLLDFYRSVDRAEIINTTIVTRIKDTKHQTIMNHTERKHNLIDAFKLNGDVVGQKILIIDDVVTTTNSVNELAKLLKQHGAISVNVCCLMRTT